MRIKNLKFFLGLIALTTLALGKSLEEPLPKVCLDNKEICYKGSWMTTGLEYNATFASFQGIQYAQAPIGDLRFKSPLPYQESNGDHDVSKKVDILCTQFDGFPGSKSSEVVVQEDCLLLNIYAPEIAIDGLPLPVLVWIHGGSLQVGSGRMDEYGPQYFMETENVVVVTINYRLALNHFVVEAQSCH